MRWQLEDRATPVLAPYHDLVLPQHDLGSISRQPATPCAFTSNVTIGLLPGKLAVAPAVAG
jgi:hypothetical protein